MKKILIVEDDRDIIELVRYNLEKENFRVQAVEDGVTGLTQIRKSRPDMIILDLMLPRLSGLEICREIRQDSSLPRIPIIMLTARADEADRVVGLETGADDYVPKPFSPRELVARVKAPPTYRSIGIQAFSFAGSTSAAPFFGSMNRK